MIADLLRDALHRAITTPRGDAVSLVRGGKSALRRANAVLGLPICSKDELAKRREARARLRELRAQGKSAPREKLEAPVVVYFQKNRNARELERIEELLASKKIAFRALDVTGDEAALAFIVKDARCEEDDLPVVFVGATPIGPYEALVRADVSGELAKLLS